MSVIPLPSAVPGSLPGTGSSVPFSSVTPSPISNAVGIIFPPADLRGIIDKTAQFVAKNGPEFESRVMREQNNQRFSFLFPNNPYRSYYELKVKEYQTGGEEVVKPAVPQAILDMRQKEEEKKQRKEQILALTDFGQVEAELKQPEPDQYAVSHPYIAPIDMDIIKTSAQFVARNGQRFLTGLTQRERNNPQFDFLKPSHALFGYFTSLVDAYTKCLLPPQEQLEHLKMLVNDYSYGFEKSFSKYKWEAAQEKMRKEKEDKHAEERAQMASIDWHDFVVVETIDFTSEDDLRPLAAPMDFTSQSQRLPPPLETLPIVNGTNQETAVAADLVNGGDIEMDEEDMEIEIQPKDAEGPIVPPSDAAVRDLSKATVLPASDSTGEIKLVTGYTRGKRSAGSGTVMQRCPLTGQMIPAEEMTNHLNTLLLDPRWKEEVERRKEKARKQSAFAPSEDVGSYLSAFASKRPDMFGSVEEEIKEHSDILGIEIANSAGSYDPTKGTSSEAPTMLPEAPNFTYAAAPPPPMPPPIPPPAPPPVASSAAPPMPPVIPPPIAHSMIPPGPPSGLSPALPSIPPRNASSIVPPMPPPAPPTMPPFGVSTISPHISTSVSSMDDGERESKRARPIIGEYPTELATLPTNQKHVQYLLNCISGKVLVAQQLQIEADIHQTIDTLKESLLASGLQEGLNSTQLQLKDTAKDTVLQDDQTLAFYNLGPGSVIEVSEK